MRATHSARHTARRTGLVVLAVLATILAACSGIRTNDNPTSDEGGPGLMPLEVVTREGADSAGLYLPIFLIAVVIFVLVEGLVVLIALRFRRRAGEDALPAQTHGNNLLEVTWTAIPAVVVLLLFIGSFVVLTRVEAKSDDPGVVVDATAFQWQWTFEYRDAGLSYTGAGKTGPEMVVPVDEPVRIRLHAQDVIHAFYVPQFFYKKDAVPGRTNEFEVVIEKAGTYGGQCAEFCGLSHADMYFTVRAVERAEYDAWLEAEIARANATPTPRPPAPSGEPTPPQGEVLRIRSVEADPLAYDTDVLTAKAGSSVTVEYTNDTSIPHNIAFFAGPDATAPRIAATEVKPGPGDVQTITFDAPAEPGSYFFHCDVHPVQMQGTFEVTP